MHQNLEWSLTQNRVYTNEISDQEQEGGPGCAQSSEEVHTP